MIIFGFLPKSPGYRADRSAAHGFFAADGLAIPLALT